MKLALEVTSPFPQQPTSLDELRPIRGSAPSSLLVGGGYGPRDFHSASIGLLGGDDADERDKLVANKPKLKKADPRRGPGGRKARRRIKKGDKSANAAPGRPVL